MRSGDRSMSGGARDTAASISLCAGIFYDNTRFSAFFWLIARRCPRRQLVDAWAKASDTTVARRPLSASEVEIRAHDARQDHRRSEHIHGAPTGAGPFSVFRGGGAEREALDLLVIRLRGRQADRDHDEGGNDRDQKAPVLEVNIAGDPEKSAFRIGLREPERDRRID